MTKVSKLKYVWTIQKAKSIRRYLKKNPGEDARIMLKEKQIRNLLKTREGRRKIVKRGYTPAAKGILKEKQNWSKKNMLNAMKHKNPFKSDSVYLSKRGRRAYKQNTAVISYILRNQFNINPAQMDKILKITTRNDRIMRVVQGRQKQYLVGQWKKAKDFYNKPLIKGR